MYDMVLRFGVIVGEKDFNDMCRSLNVPILVTRVNDILLSQKVDFIPDEEKINAYCNVFKEKLTEGSNFSIEKVWFIGYDKLIETKDNEEEMPNVCLQENI